MKPKIIIIAAVAEENVLGKDNQLIWHLPNDLKRFKKLTTGSTIIMGRKTYESIGRPLPKRTNIVISRQKDLDISGVVIAHSLEEAIAKISDYEKIFIIGGGEIYKQSLHLADTVELTKVYHKFEGDTWFPEINTTEFQEEFRSHFLKDEKHDFDYTFITYKRIIPCLNFLI